MDAEVAAGEAKPNARPNDVNVWYELAETSGLAGNVTGRALSQSRVLLFERRLPQGHSAPRVRPALSR